MRTRFSVDARRVMLRVKLLPKKAQHITSGRSR